MGFLAKFYSVLAFVKYHVKHERLEKPEI